jgi:hypothetical protein
MILTDPSWLHIELPRKMEMLFDLIGRWHCILDEAFDVEEKTILVLVQIVEANGTLQPMHDSRKSDGADGAIVIAASRRQGLLVFLVVVVLLVRLIFQERDKPCIQGFVVREIPTSLVLQFFSPHF